jgi:hypothetical protein
MKTMIKAALALAMFATPVLADPPAAAPTKPDASKTTPPAKTTDTSKATPPAKTTPAPAKSTDSKDTSKPTTPPPATK